MSNPQNEPDKDALDELLDGYDPFSGWPNCSTPDCGNKACIWANHQGACGKCATLALGEAEMTRRYDATHQHSLAWTDAHPDDDNPMTGVFDV